MTINTPIYFLFLTIILVSCSSEDRSMENKYLRDSARVLEPVNEIKEVENTDTIKGRFLGLNHIDTSILIAHFHSVYMDSMVKYKSKDLPFDDDHKFKVDSLKSYNFDFNWNVFIVEGVLLPSKASYYFFGVIKNKHLIQSEFHSQPVDISVKFEKYAYTKHSIAIYGEMWTDVGSEHNSKEHKESSVLLSAYDD